MLRELHVASSLSLTDILDLDFCCSPGCRGGKGWWGNSWNVDMATLLTKIGPEGRDLANVHTPLQTQGLMSNVGI